jgi:DNA polymerase III alpha subunit
VIQIKTHTEFSFRKVFGPISRVLKASEGPIGICDQSGTWGHVQFYKACKEAGRKPLFGVELAVVTDAKLKEKQGTNWMSFIAVNDKGLQELYELASLASDPDNFYYFPRIDYRLLCETSSNLLVLSGSHPEWSRLPRFRPNLFVELSPTSSSQSLQQALKLNLPVVATSDNYYPAIADKQVYEVISGRERQMRTSPMHLLSKYEWKMLWPNAPADALSNQQAIADLCTASLPKARMVHFTGMPSLRTLCEKAAKRRKINLKNKVYADRLTRELDLIAEKKFEDYFYLVSDMVMYAKKHMLVGPARGSSCGSLVCYLLEITDVDPIPYNLLFERFIDINRSDLPDIDIDFQDTRREMVFDYIRAKYGAENVARLGTVLRYKAKSAIGDVAKTLQIPKWEVQDLSDAIVERSTGDARAAFCILDTFEGLDIGRKTLEKFPQLRVAAEIENYAKASGQHAAGIVVTSDRVSRYCSIDRRTGAAQVDKKDAETLNLLKIDALGLRTLSVIQDCLDHIGWTREQLLAYPTDDTDAFAILNKGSFSGIFQFEGYALQSLCGQMKVENFEDIASLTALARPGPLESGGAAEFIKRRIGKAATVHLHPSIAGVTKVTYGIVIYQEQVIQIAREMGNLSWEDVTQLRKAMSKSLGKEFFDGYWARFRLGAIAKGIKEEDARLVWDQINTMGSWSFNRSHAVAYGLVSYWTMVLKARFPLQFATACLRNAKETDQGILLLRELAKEGFKYRAFDLELSEESWTVQNGVLIGGLTNVKGIGEKTAQDILERRRTGQPLTNGQRNKLANGTTPYDSIFECEERWGHLKRNPEKFNIRTPITDIGQISDSDEGEFLIIGKIKEKDLRDLNDPNAVKKRDGKVIKGQSLILHITAEDDTGNIRVTIDRHNYKTWGVPLMERAKIGDWFLWKGRMKKGFRRISCTRWRRLEEEKSS